MDPMQIQNQQPVGTIPQQQIPVQQIQQDNQQNNVQQPVQQSIQQQTNEWDSFFDKTLKGIVDFIAKFAAPKVENNTNKEQTIQNTPPTQQPQQIQNIPWAWFLGSIWNTLENIWDKAFDLTKNSVSNIIDGAQNSVSNNETAPVNNQPTAPVNNETEQTKNK